MANGDDFQPPTEGGSSNQPTESPPQGPDGGEDPSGLSGIDEGWGEGRATFDEVVDNVKAVFRGFQGNILFAWLALAALTLGLETLEVLIHVTGAVVGPLGGLIGLLSIPAALLAGLGGFVVTAGQLTLYGPLREKVFHGIEPESWSDALGDGFGHFLQVLIALVAIVTGIVITCVIPGLVLAFFAIMAPYYLATTDLDVVDAFKRSYETSKKYWQVFVVTIGALFGAGLVGGCFFGTSAALTSVLPGTIGYIFSTYVGWVGSVAMQFLVFVVWGGVFVTVDANESGQTVRV